MVPRLGPAGFSLVIVCRGTGCTPGSKTVGQQVSKCVWHFCWYHTDRNMWTSNLPSSLKRALASSKMSRILWTAQEYNFPKVTSNSKRLKGGIRSTSFRQSNKGSLKWGINILKANFWYHTHNIVFASLVSSKVFELPNAGSFWYDPLPPTKHCILDRWQEEAFGCQLQHSLDSFKSHLRPLQLPAQTTFVRYRVNKSQYFLADKINSDQTSPV